MRTYISVCNKISHIVYHSKKHRLDMITTGINISLLIYEIKESKKLRQIFVLKTQEISISITVYITNCFLLVIKLKID